MTAPTPIIYVSHLPSASSFYASITQPLNIRYLSATNSFPATLHFGHITDVGKEILFSITQSPIPNPRPTNIYLPAPSPKAIQDFYNKSCVLNPGCRDTHIGETEEGPSTRSITRDLDGNLVEAMYSSRGMRRVQTLETASTEGEARRVLAWQKEVAKSVSAGDDDGRSQVSGATETINRAPPPARRAESYPQPMRLVQRQTITETYTPHDPSQADNRSGGISGKAIIGTLLGAAAGAAVAYAMVRSESPTRYPPNSSSNLGSGPRPRRASVAGPPPGYYVAPIEMAPEPPRSQISVRGEESPRYVQYTIAPAPPMVRSHTHDMSRMIDERSHVSHRSGTGSRTRAASEHRGSRFDHHGPLAILPRERDDGEGTSVSRRSRRSEVKSYHTAASKKSHHSRSDEERKSHHSSVSKRESSQAQSHVSERESYTSARSHGTESTIRPSKHKSGSTTTIKVIGNSNSPSRVSERDRERSEKRSYVSAREVPLPRSVVSVARDIPLPESVVGFGGSNASRYAASVAPSDSVSSVGLKRERERLRDRMVRGGERW